MTFGEFELLTRLHDHDGAVLWIARDASANVCELLVYDEMRDDVDEAFFRGEELPRFRAVDALGDARFGRMRGTIRVENRNAIAFAHTPLVTLDELRARAQTDAGLAFPLLLAVMRDVVDALAFAHAAGVSGLEWFGVGVDGCVRFLCDGTGGGADFDLGPLGPLCASLAFGGVMPRSGFPVRMTSVIAWLLDRRNRPTAATIREWLDDDELAWARWTPEQVVAELRALFPDLESRV